MNVIFLDVDGVLNSSAYFDRLRKERKEQEELGVQPKAHEEISDYHLQMLAELIHTTNAKIVLSSTWRQLMPSGDKVKELSKKDQSEAEKMWQYLVDSLARYGMEIYDVTPILCTTRPKEIKAWLDSQPNKDEISFVSIEDDYGEASYHEAGLDGHLVRTTYFCSKEEYGGLQPLDVIAAIDILKNA